MYQTSTPYGQDPYRGAPVGGPMRSPYAGGYNPGMQHPQQQQRYTSPPQPQPPQAGFRQSIPQQQFAQQYPQGQGFVQPRGGGGGDTGRPYKGTLPPGQMVRVGQHAVRVERYLSEGGYAHVYLTSSDKPVYPPKRSAAKGRWGEKGYTTHCLKRIAFEDESVWRDVSREIEVMKALPPSPHLIQYLDSSHHRLPNGTHEVFILMEFCSGGGIIDLLNKRLRDRLKEIEILNIFTDVCEAVAAMHAMSRPLLHRDLKIENVLSHPNGLPPTPQRPTPLVFKLCDFGSTTFPASHPPQNKAEADALAMDLNKHTTLQYRSPEMVEPMLGWAVGLPSDVWALGVLLYKLCYYTTPFEEHGTLAIVNAKYTFPQYPVYSPRLQHLIASMLVEHPSRRPNVFEVLRVVHEMSGTRPLVDYPMPNRQQLSAALPPSPKKSKASGNVLDFTSGSPGQTAMPVPQPSLASQVQPQRRGRPTRPESMKATAQQQQQQLGQGQPQTAPMPRMPVPASTTGPSKPTKMQVTGEGPTPPANGARLQHSVSLSRRTVSGTKPVPVLARLQGSAFDRPAGSAPSPQASSNTRQGSVDAFGLSKNRGTPSPGGFGDSFGAPIPPPKDAPKDTSRRTPDAFGTTSTGDAFGMSKFTGQKASSPAGFGDSFGGSFAASGPPAPQLPVGAAGPPPPQLPSGASGPPPPQLPRPARGFTDSFDSPPVSAKVSPAQTARVSPASTTTKVSPPSPQKSGHTASRPISSTSTQRKSQDSAASPRADMTFEQRFPSLDELHSDESRPAKASPSPPQAQSPPATGHVHRPSISIANLTGGNMPKNNRLSVAGGDMPHPRSTHVTGTAFKGDSLKPPATNVEAASPTADYLSLLDDEVEAAPKEPVDLFSGNDESLSVALAPLQPTLSRTPSSGSRWGVSQPAALPPTQAAQARPPPPVLPKPQATPNKTLGAADRAKLPQLSTQRPTSNFNSENWSPLQTMKRTPPPISPDSSDDEAAPESAEGTYRRPVSPVKSGSIVHPPSPGIARRVAAYQQSATTGPSTSPPKSGYGTWSGRGTTRGARPQSMFDAPRSGSASKLSPPLVSTRSGSPGSGTHSPSSHSRRGSINDIVNRYEALNTGGVSPVKESFVPNGNPRTSIFGKPAPAIASKPAGLGLSSGSGGRPGLPRKPSGPRVPRAAPATQPKPAGLVSTDLGAGGKENAPAAKPKPVTMPKPQPQQPPAAAPPLHRATSKPDLAPKPAVLPKPKRAETLPAPMESGGSSRSSSPEKQQPVNLLIQRWNKGELKNK